VTYDPPGRLVISKLLGVSPFLQEFVRGVEVGRDRPFTEPQGIVLELSVKLNPVEV
jgi:hypothetical protein